MTVLLHAPADVGVEDHGDVVYVAPLPDGPIRVLEGIAALIWQTACSGPAETIADRVLVEIADPPAGAAAVIEALVGELRERGLLVPAAAG